MARIGLAILGTCFLTLSLGARQADTTFEVASVKENIGPADSQSFRWEPSGLRTTNMPLEGLMIFAFGANREGLIGLPGWARTARYDINASLTAALQRPDIERRTALQNLLRDRFKLVIQPTTRDMDAYSLVRVSDTLGPSMQQSALNCEAAPKPDCGYRIDRAKGQLTGRAMTADQLALALRTVVTLPVLNRTALRDRYDITLQWTPEVGGVSLQSTDGASIFTAVQEQLGLRLVPTKAPSGAFIVDRIERPEAD